MADAIDRAQEREQLDRELALEQHAQRAREGLAFCVECDEGISDVRRALGARRCVACQESFESEERRRVLRGCV